MSRQLRKCARNDMHISAFRITPSSFHFTVLLAKEAVQRAESAEAMK